MIGRGNVQQTQSVWGAGGEEWTDEFVGEKDEGGSLTTLHCEETLAAALAKGIEDRSSESVLSDFEGRPFRNTEPPSVNWHRKRRARRLRCNRLLFAVRCWTNRLDSMQNLNPVSPNVLAI